MSSKNLTIFISRVLKICHFVALVCLYLFLLRLKCLTFEVSTVRIKGNVNVLCCVIKFHSTFSTVTEIGKAWSCQRDPEIASHRKTNTVIFLDSKHLLHQSYSNECVSVCLCRLSVESVVSFLFHLVSRFTIWHSTIQL